MIVVCRKISIALLVEIIIKVASAGKKKMEQKW